MKREEILEEDKIFIEERLSSQFLENEGKDDKLNSSIKKLISMTNNFQEEVEDSEEMLEELEDFPYLNEFIRAILYRLKLSSAIELEKGLKIEGLKQIVDQIEVRNSELEDEIARFKTSVELMKEENKLLRTTNQKI